MGTVYFLLLLSVFVWSALYQWSLLLIYFTILFIYYFLSLKYEQKKHNTPSKKFKAAVYDASASGFWKIKFHIDTSYADAFLAEFNKKNPDLMLSYTHIGLKALANALLAGNNNFAKINFGSLVPLESPTISTIVNIKDKNLTMIPVKDVDKKGIVDIRKSLKNIVKTTKLGKNKDVNMMKQVFRFISPIIIRLIGDVLVFVIYSLDITINKAFTKEHFGTAVLTNVSNMHVMDSFLKAQNEVRNSVLLSMNRPVYRGVVDESGEIQIRKIMVVNASLEARVYDILDSKELGEAFKSVWRNPDKYL